MRPEFAFDIPRGYDWLLKTGMVTFRPFSPIQPWYFVDDQELIDVSASWPDGGYEDQLISFAKRQDTDDMACFAIRDGKVVAIVEIHAWTGSGFEVVEVHGDFWDWVRNVVDDIAEKSRD